MAQNDEILIFCENITYLRKRHGYSFTKMAQALRTTIRTLKRIESGEVPPRLRSDIVFYASKLFNVSPSALFSPCLLSDMKVNTCCSGCGYKPYTDPMK